MMYIIKHYRIVWTNHTLINTTNQSNVGGQSCCNHLNITSKGAASKVYPMLMGRYEKYSTDRLGVPTYKRDDFILYKRFGGSRHTNWFVSKQY